MEPVGLTIAVSNDDLGWVPDLWLLRPIILMKDITVRSVIDLGNWERYAAKLKNRHVFLFMHNLVDTSAKFHTIKWSPPITAEFTRQADGRFVDEAGKTPMEHLRPLPTDFPLLRVYVNALVPNKVHPVWPERLCFDVAMPWRIVRSRVELDALIEATKAFSQPTVFVEFYRHRSDGRTVVGYDLVDGKFVDFLGESIEEHLLAH